MTIIYLFKALDVATFRSREDHQKQIQLEEACKSGLAPAEFDEDGKEINPHIPRFISSPPCLKHQRKRISHPNNTSSRSSRVTKTFQASKYRKGACENCGAMTHVAKECMERARKVDKSIAADEKKETFETAERDYERKRDRWEGFDVSTYARVVKVYEARDHARMKYLKEQKLKKLEKGDQNDEGAAIDESEDDLRLDEAKVDEMKQMDFAKVEKRVRTTGGGSRGTVRNLRIREDTAKYLLNLDVNSAHYDPKTRSMREDPLPESDPNEKFYLGDNHYRNSGQALEVKELNNNAREAFDKGQDVHMLAGPSQVELLHKNFKVMKEKSMSQWKKTIIEKYNYVALKDPLPRELLLGQSERQILYDRAGRIIKGEEALFPRSKDEEDI
ncbi:Pre-mRNA-splicing factor SLU7-like protein [Medicago truncatula]|uniref:Pre-mRNA-splicing factor SLU7 n=1 Tax=Medicago truncatula TaxID=3880 RepID=A0A072VND7_MEDTR|nr:Pre-mRNA-splicing factor SLU7-like protein [Medicago truncatula]